MSSSFWSCFGAISNDSLTIMRTEALYAVFVLHRGLSDIVFIFTIAPLSGNHNDFSLSELITREGCATHLGKPPPTF